MAGTMNMSELARVCGLSKPTVYKYLNILALRGQEALCFLSFL